MRSIFTILALGTCLTPSLAYSQSTKSHASDTSQTPAVVALASSFRTVWPALADAYTAETGNPNPLVSFGSSGLLTTQILHGAPFELYLSADEATVNKLHSANKTRGEKITMAIGKLSLVWRGTGKPSLAQIGDIMKDDQTVKIAIANPRHAPYGIAAQQAINNAGLQPLPRGRLLTAENASQALQYALNGGVTAALVPTSLVQRIDGNFEISQLDDASYQPIVHCQVLLQSAGKSAIALSNWLKTPKALAIMQRSGLSAP